MGAGVFDHCYYTIRDFPVQDSTLTPYQTACRMHAYQGEVESEPMLRDRWSLASTGIGRREFIGNGAKMVAALALYEGLLRPLVEPALQPAPVEPPRPQRFGATFSQIKTQYMGLDYRDAFREVLTLDLDFIRLGAYWSEIEPEKGEIAHFEKLDWLIDEAAKQGRAEVILTVGMKAPVYPEFHFPPWVLEEILLPKVGVVSQDPRLREYVLRFVRAVVERYGAADVVKYIQVENEPFDPVLYDYQTYRLLGEEFLREEIEMVRAVDPRKRPILLNLFVETSPLTTILANVESSPLYRLVAGSPVGRRERLDAIELADIVGYDVYAAVGWDFLGGRFYIRPWRRADYNNLVVWRQRAESAGKRAYIMEAQAEPWEPGSAVHIKQREYPSFNPEAMVKFVDRLVELGYRDVCFWGVEHWLWHRRAGHPEWWDTGLNIMSRYR